MGSIELSPFVLSSNDTDEPVDLPLGRVSLGRGQSNDIRVPSAQVTRRHATLRVDRDRLQLIDHGGTNGTFVNGTRVRDNLELDRATLKIGDQVSLGEYTFTVRAADWVTREPPGEMIVYPATGERVERAWARREVSTEWDDELWAAYYLRWRSAFVDQLHRPISDDSTRDSNWPIAAAGRMCSPPMLQWLRSLLIEQDNRRWFLGCHDHYIEMFSCAEHGIGPLLAFDVARRHPDGNTREFAWLTLQRMTVSAGQSDIATAIFDRVPRESTSISALVAPVFEKARPALLGWAAPQFLDLMSRPSFAEAAEWVVFSVRNASRELVDTFRPSDGDLLGLDEAVVLDSKHFVQVASAQDLSPEARRRWREHLAEFEVVQPFAQFDR